MNNIQTTPETEPLIAGESLPEHPLFQGMRERDRHILSECSMRATFEPGTLVVESGKPANCFYLILSGLITLETPGVHSPLRVQTIRAGDVLGWSWFFPPYCWHFNAMAEERTETIFFFGSRLLQECDRNHDFGYDLFKRMSRIMVSRLQTTREKWIEAAQIAAPRLGIPVDYLII